MVAWEGFQEEVACKQGSKGLVGDKQAEGTGGGGEEACPRQREKHAGRPGGNGEGKDRMAGLWAVAMGEAGALGQAGLRGLTDELRVPRNPWEP